MVASSTRGCSISNRSSSHPAMHVTPFGQHSRQFPAVTSPLSHPSESVLHDTAEFADKLSAEVGELLRQIAIFSELDDGVIHPLACRCVARDFGTGSVLFSAWRYMSRTLCDPIPGSVRIYRTSPDGKEQVLHIEGAGRPIAELPLFDGGVYPASAVPSSLRDSSFLRAMISR